MEINILMIDDHPAILEGYKLILSYNNFGHTIATQSLYNCEQAYSCIVDSKNSNTFQLVFIDVTLPPYLEKNIQSGIDLAMLVKKHWQNTKIIMLTSHTEALILTDIIQKINPSALLIKSDFTSQELLLAYQKVFENEIYYSKTVLLHKKNNRSNNFVLDNYNRQIIQLLAQGAKTKTLQEVLFLSRSGIDKRKAQIKLFLNIDKGTDQDILAEAKKRGWI